ncbi:MAG TPA: integrase core domain-containing protein [Polyangiaceae bacterium]|nr:integrase core domain-containing protein [Polyangiaceae bacterium]
MSATRSETTRRRYGVERVCAAWDVPRSTFYARRARREPAATATTTRRGPRPPVSNERLLEYIRADLKRTPFLGEGYRKVWARLRVLDGVRVGRKRVLRLMREHQLLSPHRRASNEPKPHDGTITTNAPNVLWGTDGARVFTVEDGWGWVFVAVEHFNAECVGYHGCKQGDRFAALEPLAMGLVEHYGSVAAGVARGLAVRMDHGTQYLSDHFLNQLRFWGIAPSFAFVAEPETNGVAERFNRTLKEQAIYGRVFANLDEVRAAVAAFVRRYNAEWLVEKLGFRSPLEARAGFTVRAAA